jgi:hypothetical protein
MVRNRTTPEEDVKVEVSLDVRADLYAVMVSDHATNIVQSVMAIPKDDCTRRSSRLLRQTQYSQRTGRMTPQVVDQSALRRADLMRNLSPINNERSSPFDADHHDRRRKVQSLPPTTERGPTQCAIDERRRESSCAPKLGGRGATNSSSTEVVKHSSSRVDAVNKSRKPNFVSTVSTRRRFFGSIRPRSRKVHNDPN